MSDKNHEKEEAPSWATSLKAAADSTPNALMELSLKEIQEKEEES